MIFIAPPKTIWLCKECRNESDDIKIPYNALSGTGICKKHNIQMDTININVDEYLVITKISQDINFLEAMIDLKQKDIIEYNLKMSQFKAQLSQSKQVEESNKPQCIYCKSTNIKKISTTSKVGSVALFGIFGMGKTTKQFHCNNCNSDF